MHPLHPIELRKWIDGNRHLLRPPVGNKLIYEDSEFIVMAVGGPNSRKDFHVDPAEEFFHQIEGEMVLRVVQDGAIWICRSAPATCCCCRRAYRIRRSGQPIRSAW